MNLLQMSFSPGFNGGRSENNYNSGGCDCGICNGERR